MTTEAEAEASELGLSHTGPEATGKPSANHQSERKSMSLQTGWKVFAGNELCRKDSAALKTFLWLLWSLADCPVFLHFALRYRLVCEQLNTEWFWNLFGTMQTRNGEIKYKYSQFLCYITPPYKLWMTEAVCNQSNCKELFSATPLQPVSQPVTSSCHSPKPWGILAASRSLTCSWLYQQISQWLPAIFSYYSPAGWGIPILPGAPNQSIRLCHWGLTLVCDNTGGRIDSTQIAVQMDLHVIAK